MNKFEITANATPMGIYEGECAADALNAYAVDAGYDDYAAVVEQFGDDDEITCTQISE